MEVLYSTRHFEGNRQFTFTAVTLAPAGPRARGTRWMAGDTLTVRLSQVQVEPALTAGTVTRLKYLNKNNGYICMISGYCDRGIFLGCLYIYSHQILANARLHG